MSNLGEKLSNHPVQAGLTALASIATICTFIYFLRTESCNKKEERKKKVSAIGQILDAGGLPIRYAKYTYRIGEKMYFDNADYNGEYRIKADTDKEFRIMVHWRPAPDSFSTFITLMLSDAVSQNITLPDSKKDKESEVIPADKINETKNREKDPGNGALPPLNIEQENKPGPIAKAAREPSVNLPTFSLKYNDGNQIPYYSLNEINKQIDGHLDDTTTLTTLIIPTGSNNQRIKFSFYDPVKKKISNGWIDIKHLERNIK